MNQKSSTIMALILGALVLLTAGYFAVTMTAEKVSKPERGYFLIGTNTPFAPFEIKNGDRVVGFDIDLAERIAVKMGKKLMIKDFSEFDSLLPSLQAGSLDMVVSAVSISEGRREVVSFSEPYYNTSQAVLIKKNNSDKFKQSCAPESFFGLSIGYQKGTTSESWAEKNISVNSKLVSFSDIPFAIQLLRVGSLDAILIDGPVAESIAFSNPDLMVAGTIKTDENYGIAVERGDPKKLLQGINAAIAEMKKNGEHQKLVDQWLGGAK